MSVKSASVAKTKKKVASLPRDKGVLIVLFCLAFFVGFLTHVLINVIFAETQGDGKIHACVGRNGQLRIVTDAKKKRFGDENERGNKLDKDGCRENEVAMEWNIQGPMGPAGSGGGGNSFPIICPNCDVGGAAGDRLAGKDLSNGLLGSSILSDNNFTQTNLSNADLSAASLQRANLTSANFSNANLEGSDFSEANFDGTNLKGARVQDTKFDGAKWNNATCPDGSNSNNNGNTCVGH